VIDAYSRRVIGWALDDRVEDELTLTALRRALELRRPAVGLVHHSDRGSQYASGDYTNLLKAHGCQISMSHKASPWENAGCESWMKTLKAEEVYRQEYHDLREARGVSPVPATAFIHTADALAAPRGSISRGFASRSAGALLSITFRSIWRRRWGCSATRA
jgi:transposase InsO family protein